MAETATQDTPQTDDDLGFVPAQPQQSSPAQDDDLGFVPAPKTAAPQPYAMPDGRMIDPETHTGGVPNPHAVAPNQTPQQPMATVSAAPPQTMFDRARQWAANSGPGEALETYAPGVSRALNLEPTESETARMQRESDTSAFEYHPVQAVKTMAAGFSNLAKGSGQEDGGPTFIPGGYTLPATKAPSEIPTNPSQIARGATQIMSGAMSAGKPLIVAGVAEAPIRAAITYGAGILAGKGSAQVAQNMGATPDEVEFFNTAGFFIPGVLTAAAGIEGASIPEEARVIDPVTHEPVPVRGGAVGGKGFGVGHAVTDTGEHIIQARVGPYSGSVRFGRNISPANGAAPSPAQVGPGEVLPPAPPVDPVAIQQRAQQATIEETAANAQTIDLKAAQVAGLAPPPPPPPAPGQPGSKQAPLPAGMANGQLSQQVVENAGKAISSLPPAVQSKGVLEATGNLAKWMFVQKTFVGPDGKVVNVDSQKAAQTEAVNLINNEVDRQKGIKEDNEQAQKDALDKQQADAEQAASEREQAREEAEKNQPPAPIPDTPQIQAVRAALAKLPPDTPKADVILAARKAAAGAKFMLTYPLAFRLADEHIATRAQQETAASAGITGEKINPDQDPIALGKMATDVQSGKAAFLQVAPGTKFKPDGLTKENGFVYTDVKKAQDPTFNGRYYHPKEIPSKAVKAALSGPSPLAALQQLELDWRASKTLKTPEEENRSVLSESPEQTQLGNPAPATEPAETKAAPAKAETPASVAETKPAGSAEPLSYADEVKVYGEASNAVKARGIKPDDPEAWGTAIAEEEARILDERKNGKPEVAQSPAKQNEPVAAKVEEPKEKPAEIVQSSTGNAQPEKKAVETSTFKPGQKVTIKNADGTTRTGEVRFANPGGKLVIKGERKPVAIGDVNPAESSAPFDTKPIAGSDGKPTTVLTPTRDLSAKYRIVEADDLHPSHNAQTFAKTAGYPEGLQERAYDTSKEAQNRVIQQAQNYDPRYTINTNPDAVNGPPVVTPDGTVLGGNSRAMSTQRLYAGNGDAYKSALKEQATAFGFKPEQIDAMKKPVLVREIASPATPDEARRIGSELNKSMTGALGVSERAVSAGKNIRPDTLRSVAAMMQADDSTLREAMGKHGGEIVKMLAADGAITDRERPQFVDAKTGGLSEEGKTFVERALMGSVIDDPRLMDAAPKSVMQKLERSLGSITSFASRPDEWNLIPAVRAAVSELGAMQRAGSTVDLWTGQTSLFGGERNPLVDALMRTLDDKPNTVRKSFDDFSRDADQNLPGQARFFAKADAFDAFNAAFGSKLSEQEYHDGLEEAAAKDPKSSEVTNAQGGEGIPEQPEGNAPSGGQGSAQDSQIAATLYSNPLDPALFKRLIGQPLMKMAEPLREALEKHGDIAEVAHTVDGVLRQIDKNTTATTLGMKAAVRAMADPRFTHEDAVQVFDAREDPAIRLTPRQTELRDNLVAPLNQATRQEYVIEQLIKSGKFSLEDILGGKVPDDEVRKLVPDSDNYQHRIAVGKDTLPERLVDENAQKFQAGGGKLSKAFSSEKARTFREIHGTNGEREAVGVKGDRVVQFVNKDNAAVLDARIADAKERLADEKAKPEPDEEKTDNLQRQIDELNGQKQTIAEGGRAAVDIGPYRSGFITTQEIADKAAAPLETKLSKLLTEFHTLHGSQSRARASQQRIENLYYQIDGLEKQIAAVRASVGPEEQAKTGLTDADLEAHQQSDIDALGKRIEKLQARQTKLQGTEGRSPAQDRELKNIPGHIAEAKETIDGIRDAATSRNLEGRYWQDKNDNLWKFDQGTAKFISERTGQDYFRDARLAGLINHMEVDKAMNAAIALEKTKSLLEDAGMAVKVESAKNAPDGWKPTTLPQFRNYYFPEQIADTLDHFQYKQTREPNVFTQANNALIQFILMNPGIHWKNIVAAWGTGKAAEFFSGKGLDPRWYADQVKAGTQAANTMRDIGGLEYQRVLRAGLDLRGADSSFDATMKDTLRQWMDQLNLNPQHNAAVSALIGVKDAAKFFQKWNHELTFSAGDVATLQSFYAKRTELVRKGMDSDSAEAAAKDYVHQVGVGEYTTPAQVAGSAKLGKMLDTPELNAFWPYHFGYLWRPLAKAIGDAVGPDRERFRADEEASQQTGETVNKMGQTPWEQRRIAIARLLFLALWATQIQPYLNKKAKEWLGDLDAEFPAGGPTKLVSDAYEAFLDQHNVGKGLVAAGAKTAGELVMPSPGLRAAVGLTGNYDTFLGRHVYNPNGDPKEIGEQIGTWLVKGTYPAQIQGASVRGGWKVALEKFAGVNFPLHNGMKAAMDIRSDESGKLPPDPVKSRTFKAILAAAQQSHQSGGNNTTLADGLRESGKLTASEKQTLNEAIREAPIVFAVHGLEKPADYWRVYEHSTDAEKSALLHDHATRHELNVYQKGLRAQGKTDEADKVLDTILAAK